MDIVKTHTDRPLGTWEPPFNLDGTDLIPRWEQLKVELDSLAFQHENERNIEAYEEAQAKADAVKARKHAKREQKRPKKQPRNSKVITDDDSSDEEPVMLARARDSLFVEDRPPAVPVSSKLHSARTRKPPVARRPPLQQSSSEGESLSEGEISDHSLIGGPRKSNAQGKEDRSTIKMTKSGPVPLNKKSEIAASTTASTATSEAPTIREKAGQALGASTTSTVAKGGDTAANSVRPRPAPRDSTTSNTMRAIRTVPPERAPCTIAFVDEPNEKSRNEWSIEHHYGKLKYRGLAEKRSRTEGVPDFSALTFVNGPPPTLPRAAVPKPNDNPYGRRETTNRRVQEDYTDDRPQRGFSNVTGPLATWETDKVPLVCFDWYTSSCSRTARDCRFMHRESNPERQLYAIGDMDGRVPHKYRRPPITCPYWYKGRKCTKTAEECLYAHKDTGWGEINGVPTEIARLPSEYLDRVAPSLHIPPKFQNPPITCSYWLRDPHGCNKTETDCKYAHQNTGWVHPESDPNAPPVSIDKSLNPHGGPPKYANPPVTCPFWWRSEKGCTKTDDDCRFAHWNTGWAPPGLSNDRPLPINREELPRSHFSKKARHTSGATSFDPNSIPPAHDSSAPKSGTRSLTCFFWLEGARGCDKTAARCRFAHTNTGWMARIQKDRKKPPISEKIDLKRLPRFREEGEYLHFSKPLRSGLSRTSVFLGKDCRKSGAKTPLPCR